MKFQVFFTEDAERDLEEIFDFLCRRRGVSQAERVVRESPIPSTKTRREDTTRRSCLKLACALAER